MPTHDHGDAILVLPYPSEAPHYEAPYAFGIIHPPASANSISKPHKLRGITPDSLAPILQTPQILAPCTFTSRIVDGQSPR
jgi:hypothetical protein